MPRSVGAARTGERSEETRKSLTEAAADVLRTSGFAGATARAVAGRAGCNQGLVFYHFGSVVELLLAALDEVSERRRERYEDALARVTLPSELVGVAARIFSEDLDKGDAAVLVEMIAGASSTPGLGEQIKRRIEPWSRFASEAMARAIEGTAFAAIIDPDELANAVVAFYLGLELLSHLDGDRSTAYELFDAAARLATAADAFKAPEDKRHTEPKPSVRTDNTRRDRRRE